jgi:hypothetical protein
MSYRKAFIVSNALMLGAFIWAFVKDFRAEWRPYQAKYYQMAGDALDKQAAAEKDAAKAASLRSESKKMRGSPMEIKQIIAGDLGRFDRCVTCHVGMDEYTNPSLKNEKPPSGPVSQNQSEDVSTMSRRRLSLAPSASRFSCHTRTNHVASPTAAMMVIPPRRKPRRSVQALFARTGQPPFGTAAICHDPWGRETVARTGSEANTSLRP